MMPDDSEIDSHKLDENLNEIVDDLIDESEAVIENILNENEAATVEKILKHWTSLLGSDVAELEPDEKELRKQRLKDHVDNLTENSTLHGFSNIFYKHHTFRRIFWLTITVAALGICAEKIYTSTVNYLRYPFITVKTRRYVKELPFPAISFCNINDMRMSTLRGSLIDEAIRLQNYSILANSDPAETWNLTKSSAHEIEDMILECTFNGQPCSHKNFSEFYWKQGERCFTFNDGKSELGVLALNNAGRRSSLELTINIQHYDYYRDRSKAGIHMILHDQEETPVRLEGPMISPGFSTHVQFKERKYINLPAPYKTNCGKKKLSFFNAYSKNLCWLDSVTKHVETSCGCKDYFMPGDHIPVCGIIELMSCTWPQWEKHDKDKAFHCPLPCEMITFGHTLTRAKYPSEAHAQYIMKKFPVLKEAHGNNTGKLRTQKEFLRDTLVRLVIYCDELSYELIQLKPSYDTLNWLGDVGGTVSLFVGAGVMTYFEFLDCLIMVLYSVFFEKFRK